MPNRILKESICTSDSIDRLTWFEEVLFYRLIVNCDDYGRFDGRAAIIKNRLFPLKENLTAASVEKAISQLANAGLVTLYMFEGKPYLYLPTWADHQNVRSKKSKYPSPEISSQADENSVNTSANICTQMYANVPVIQSNPNPIQSEYESVSESYSRCENTTTTPTPPPPENAEAAKAVAAYQDKLGTFLSSTATRELIGFTKSLGAELCIHALDAALDNGQRNWNYIKAILNRYCTEGFTNVAQAVDEENEHRRKLKGGSNGNTGKTEKYAGRQFGETV